MCTPTCRLDTNLFNSLSYICILPCHSANNISEIDCILYVHVNLNLKILLKLGCFIIDLFLDVDTVRRLQTCRFFFRCDNLSLQLVNSLLHSNIVISQIDVTLINIHNIRTSFTECAPNTKTAQRELWGRKSK